jgi:putative lipoic acid-binding regulatory protein
VASDKPFGDAAIEFPVSFDLRVIYLLASGATLEEDAMRILLASRAQPSRPVALPAPGAKYGRLSIPVTFGDKESMRAAYAALGALPCVKAVM